MDKNLYQFCTEGCSIKEEMISVSQSVSLRVITFSPPRSDHALAVFFVAGWVSQIEGWTDVLTEMTKDHIVYYVETREKISSVVPRSAKYDVYTIGEDVIRLVQLLGLRENEYVFFGSSLGATVILDCYLRLKQKPCSLILVAPNAEFRIPWFWKCVIFIFYPPFYFLLKPVIKWYLKHFRLNVKTDYAQYEKYSRALDSADARKLKGAAIPFSRYKVWNILKEVDVPTLIIGGSHDKLHEPENLKQMINLLPKARYIDLETNRRTHAAEVVIVMRKFIQELNCVC